MRFSSKCSPIRESAPKLSSEIYISYKEHIMNMEKILQESSRYIVPTYGRYPIAFERGKGAYIESIDKKTYLDFLAGIAVNTLGYGHPALARAARSMAPKVWHTSNFFHIKSQIGLAKLIARHSLKGKTFFCNSGAEANEAALKLAIKYGKSIREQKCNIVTLLGSFHGRTLGSLTLTGQEKHRRDFPPAGLVSYVPLNDIAALEEAVDKNTAAVFVEAIQGEGGINPMNEDYYDAIRTLTKKHKALMIIDEVQTGIGRTGKMFAYQHYSKAPDIITLAKGLGGGFPIGAMHVSRKYADDYLVAGTHASTFGGNHFATSVAEKTLKVVAKKGFLDDVNKTADYFKSQLEVLRNEFGFVKEIRGKGLMLALDIDLDAKDVVQKCLDAGLIINAVKEKTLRFVPPLIIGTNEVDECIRILTSVFKQY